MHFLRQALHSFIASMLLLVSGFSVATTYNYWGPYPDNGPNYFQEGSAACSAYLGIFFPTQLADGRIINQVSTTHGAAYQTCGVCKRNSSTGELYDCSDNTIARHTITCTDPLIPDFTKYPLVCSEPPPPPTCAAKTGQKFQRTALCYRITCAGAGGWVSQPDGSINCTGGYVQTSYPIPSPINKDSCEAVFVRELPDEPLTSNGQTGIGQTTIDGFCTVEYQFTGNNASGADTPATPPPENSTPVGANNSGSGGTGGDGSGGTGGTGGDGSGGTGGDGSGGTGGDGSGGSGSGGTGNGDGSGNCTAEQAAQGLCGGDGYSGSDECENPPQCEGDALLCGIIVQNWRDTCGLVKVTEQQRESARQAAADGVTQYEAYRQEKETAITELFSSFQADMSANGSSGSCPSDFSFHLMGKSIEIPFSETCGLFQFLRVVVLLFAYLAATRIVYSAF